jgi:hypothetical protein
MMTLASEPPMNRRRSSRIFSLHCVFKDFLHQEILVMISPRDPIQGRVARAGLDWSIAGPCGRRQREDTVDRFKTLSLSAEHSRDIAVRNGGRWLGLYPRNRT